MVESAVAAKNKRAGYSSALSTKIKMIEELSSKAPPDFKHLHAESLKSAWGNYESSHQAVLTFIARDQVDNETKKFLEREEQYKITLDAAEVILE